MATLKEINKRSVALGKRGQSLAKDVHDHCVLIAKFLKDGGDNATPCAVFVSAMAGCKAVRNQALVNWFGTFCGVEITEGDDKTFKVKKVKGYDWTQIDLDACEAMSPWELTPPEATKPPFDLIKLINQVIKRAEKAQEEGGDEVKIDEKKLKALKALTV